MICIKKDLSAIIFWGSLWGLTEATLGHFLHVFTLGVGWLFWFPIAFFFIHRSYTHTGRLSSIPCTALLAASLKLIDLFAPVRLDFVINPAVSILIEGVTLWLVFGIAGSKRVNLGPGLVLLCSMSWRCIYLAYIAMLVPSSWAAISPLGSIQTLLKFLFLESVLNTFIICVYLLIDRIPKVKPVMQAPGAAISWGMLTLAMLVQWTI